MNGPHGWIAWVVSCGVCFGLCGAVLRAPEVPPVVVPTVVTPTAQPVQRSDLRGRRVNVVMKKAFTAAPIEHENKSEGWQRFKFRDGYVFDVFTNMTGIIPIVNPPAGCKYENSSSLCSSTKDVLRGIAELTFNPEFVEPQIEVVDWGPIIHYGYTCVAMPRGSPASALVALADGVEVAAVATLIVAIMVAAVAWRWAAPSPPPNLPISAAKMFAYIISMPTFDAKPISSTAARLLSATCSLFSIVFVCLFQGVLVDNMTNTRYEREIHTLQELDDSNDRIIASTDTYARGFQGSDSELLKNLDQKVIIESRFASEEISMLEWLSNQDRVAVTMTKIAFDVSAPLTSRGRSSLHEIEEYPSVYFLAYPSSVGSPFSERLREISGWLLQSGIIKHWYDESVNVYVSKLKDKERKKGHIPAGTGESGAHVVKTIRLQDLAAVFSLAACSYGLALVLLVLEVTFGKRWLPNLRNWMKNGVRRERTFVQPFVSLSARLRRWEY